MSKLLLDITAHKEGVKPDLKRHVSGDVKATLSSGKMISLATSKSKPRTKRSKKPRPVSLSKHVKSWLGGKLSYLYDEVVRWAFLTASPFVAERQRYLDIQNKVGDTKDNWFSVKMEKQSDFKSRISTLDDQIANVKATMTSMLRGNDYSVILYQSADNYLVATVTTGIVNNVTPIVPNSASEFATLALLFDEYKMSALDVKHRNTVYPGSPGTSVDTLYRVTAADPTDNTALTSVNSGVQHSIHELLALGTNLTVLIPVIDFHVRLPKGEIFGSGGNILTNQDTWTACANPVAYCYLKHYTVQSVVTATNVDSAIFYYHLSFRLRE